MTTGNEVAAPSFNDLLTDVGGSSPAHYIDDPVEFIKSTSDSENPNAFLGEEDEASTGRGQEESENAQEEELIAAFEDPFAEDIPAEDTKTETTQANEESEEDLEKLNPVPELQAALEEIRQLKAQVADLASGKKPLDPDAAPVKKEYTLEPREYVTAENMDDLITDPKKLNEVLNGIRQEAVQIAVETALAEAPEQLVPVLSDQLYHKQLATKFYTVNPDLANHQMLCASVYTKLQEQHPGASVLQLYSKLGPAVRAELKSANSGKSAPTPPPGARPSARPGKARATGLRTQADQIKELLS